MKRVPNIISALRILGAICLLLFHPASVVFIPIAFVAVVAIFAAIQECHHRLPQQG